MAAKIGIVSRCDLEIEGRCRSQPNKSKLPLYKPLLHFYSHLKQLYISNKVECFSYKGGCDVLGCTRIEASKEELTWATDKWLLIISNIMLFKTVIYTTKKLRNKSVLSLNKIYALLCAP